jgi:hypothetical protein
MLSLHGRPVRLCDGTTRRELLRVGGLSLLGLGLPQLLHARSMMPAPTMPADKTFGRARNVIYLWLAGGPPQHETFDPKPEAPAEIRGPFKPIQTSVPGIQFCELLPRTAALADKLAVVRSISTNDNNHDGSGYWVWTGYKYVGPNSRTIQGTDWPYFGSLVKRYRPSEEMPQLSTVWIPDWARLNENVTPAGQTGGFMGREWDPDRFVGDPAEPGYKAEGLNFGSLPTLRLKQRESLLAQVERHFAAQERGDAVREFDLYQKRSFELLSSGAARRAFAIDQEPEKLRERYGRTRFGQCALLARRLIEAGVRLVHVQWPREPGDNAVDNPLWDTHAQNAERMEDVLAPTFDVGFSALIEDLDQRGLLQETLVIAIGEFGRTPKINGNGGRDHWGPVWSFAMAGAGISGGQVYGASDKTGGQPAKDGFNPGDLTATIYHLLGIDPRGTFQDREGREHRLSTGTPLYKLLGTEPATRERIASAGDPARVPPFDETQWLLSPDFKPPLSLLPASSPARPRGWRADPLMQDKPGAFGVWLDGDNAMLGIGADSTAALAIPAGATVLLAQEVRSPFAGTFRATIEVAGTAVSRECWEVFQKHFECKLRFFQYKSAAKTPLTRKDLASLLFKPALAEGKEPSFERFELKREFINNNPGQNFSFGLGLGVAVLLEKTTPGALELPAGQPRGAAIRVASVRMDFLPKARNDKVTV